MSNAYVFKGRKGEFGPEHLSSNMLGENSTIPHEIDNRESNSLGPDGQTSPND